MINFRQIFNMNYGYLGVIIVIIFLILIILINKNIQTSLKQLGIIAITASILNFLFLIIINFLTELELLNNYKIFIEVITKTFSQELTLYSLVILFLGIISLTISKILLSKVKQNH